MAHLSQLSQTLDPRHTLLTKLVAENTSLGMALQTIAAVHMGQPLAVPYRATEVKAGGHLFPYSGEVSALMALLFIKVDQLWGHCRSGGDDLLVVSFVIATMLRIHPFANGNGRTALDFGQFLLLYRWGLKCSPFVFPPHVHDELAPLLAGESGICGNDTVQQLSPTQQSAIAQEWSDSHIGLIEDISAVHLGALQTRPTMTALSCWMATHIK